MRKLFLLLAIAFSLSGYAQLDSLNMDVTQAERIVDKYTDKVTEGFNTVLEKATPVAEEGFEIAVTMQKAYGYGELTKGLGGIIIILFIFWIQRRAYINFKHNNGDGEALFWAYALGGVGQITSFIYSLSCIYDGILYLIAPEWFAIKDIIGLFSGS